MPRIEVEDAGTFDVEEASTSCKTSVLNRKDDNELHLKAMLTENDSRLEHIR